ncbi:MAG: hypothetical protein IJY73_08500, partial [Oscillospiraceae bacterium]|nr:hypothetical protein [Oscillospiraceae bacterium]
YYNFSEFDKAKVNVMIAYFLTAFVFEPDFGSFVRHEVATFVVFYSCLFVDDTCSNSITTEK